MIMGGPAQTDTSAIQILHLGLRDSTEEGWEWWLESVDQEVCWEVVPSNWDWETHFWNLYNKLPKQYLNNSNSSWHPNIDGQVFT